MEHFLENSSLGVIIPERVLNNTEYVYTIKKSQEVERKILKYHKCRVAQVTEIE